MPLTARDSEVNNHTWAYRMAGSQRWHNFIDRGCSQMENFFDFRVATSSASFELSNQEAFELEIPTSPSSFEVRAYDKQLHISGDLLYRNEVLSNLAQRRPICQVSLIVRYPDITLYTPVPLWRNSCGKRTWINFIPIAIYCTRTKSSKNEIQHILLRTANTEEKPPR